MMITIHSGIILYRSPKNSESSQVLDMHNVHVNIIYPITGIKIPHNNKSPLLANTCVEYAS